MFSSPPAAHLGLLRFLPHLRAIQNRSADYKNQVPQQGRSESLACSKEMRSLVCRIFAKIHVCFTVHLRADYGYIHTNFASDEGILVSRLRNKYSQRFLYGVTVSMESKERHFLDLHYAPTIGRTERTLQ